MPKKTTKTTQQRAKEEQWRRRVGAQTRAASPTLSNTASKTALEDAEGDTESDGYMQADMRQMPAVATPTPSNRAATTATRTTTGTSAAAAAAQRRALAASRSARSRLAINTLSVEEEMHYVRSDVRSLIILTAICLAVIIILAFLIR